MDKNKKDTQDSRNGKSTRKCVYLRLSDQEYESLDRLSLKTGLKKTSVLKEGLNRLSIQPEIVTQKDYKALLTQLIKIGTNINQISKVANSRQYISQKQVLLKISSQVNEIKSMVESGIR